MKFIVTALFLGIIISLGSGFFSMTRGNGSSQQMANALTLRVALSVALVVFLLVSWKMGLIEPHGAVG
jgi:hypothetical protein